MSKTYFMKFIMKIMEIKTTVTTLAETTSAETTLAETTLVTVDFDDLSSSKNSLS